MFNIMGGRLNRLAQCAKTDSMFLVDAGNESGFCAPIDNQGLYFLSKLFSELTGLSIETVAISILTMPTFYTIFLVLKLSWARQFLLVPIIFIALTEYIFDGRLFVLAEWAFPFWLGLAGGMSLYDRVIRKDANFLLSSLLWGVIFSLSDWIRPSTGLVGYCIIIWLIFLIRKEKNINTLILFLSAFIVAFFVVSLCTGFIDMKIEKMAENLGFGLIHMQHVFWHMILIGFGYLENSLGLSFYDGSGVDFINLHYNSGAKIDGYSKAYEALAKQAVTDIVITKPLFVLQTMLAKTAKVLVHLVSFLALFVFSNIWNKTFRKKFFQNPFSKEYAINQLIFCFLLIVACSPGILINPARYYIPAGLGLILLHSTHFFVRYSEKNKTKSR